MAEPVVTAAALEPLSETRLDPKPHGELLTYNPSIELFARAAGPRTLEIWRSNGQSVVKASQKGDKQTVEALRWKTDGEFLAVGWSDGVVRLMGLENSKAVHLISVCQSGEAKITCIGWTRNRTGKRAAVTAKPGTSWEKLSLEGLSLGEKNNKQDLPRELTFLEVETALPKLSPLPATGGSGDDMYVFTTRSSLEFLFRPFSPETADLVDVMLVGTDDEAIHLSIYDSFVIGKFQYTIPAAEMPEPLDAVPSLKLTHHASHQDLTTHSLLLQPSTGEEKNQIYLVPMDLTFIHSTLENLSLLASKTTTLQKLIRYVRQVQIHMMADWQSTRELPHRFLDSINDTLKETGKYGQMDVGQAMYHTVVTGHTFPEVKEWLVDQLAERGHKRWDKAVVSGLESVRNLVHENFLPALERIATILSRLLGIARFHDSKDEIGFTGIQITKVMDMVSSLMLVGNKILLAVMEELELFRAFSTWIRYEIDRLASSTVSDELTEKEATMEHGRILTYIQQFMPASPLRFYLSKVTTEDAARESANAEGITPLFDIVDKHIKKQEEGKQQQTTITQIEYIEGLLGRHADVVFQGIATAGKRSVRFGQLQHIKLEHDIAKLDIQMRSVAEVNHNAETYIALTEQERENSVHVFRAQTMIINGISGGVMTQHSHLQLGGSTVIDVKFLNEESLLVLLALAENDIRIIKVPHTSVNLGYHVYDPWVPAEPHVLNTEQVVSVFPNAKVPLESGFMPGQMEVREASSQRGQIPARVALLGKDGQTYKVFSLPRHIL
ncbi:hypothetical protein PFICI_12965 [Pestalotiopsis fici W106-1]|uniref:Anaphase-promoting complex subunit 4 n=1 Tax=Pestalotiopsis fici (strain W106-1 / CGMCC3.15140) TaxID=1229662 RepID=W3WT66_PESFW|nr:uncharacterized protein PFICI_12965 [Pestalotiopsis fici W106-1]ETS76021.1 hypothetical protein PFICI_12965 [Pestalotiopsis fici W106-1]